MGNMLVQLRYQCAAQKLTIESITIEDLRTATLSQVAEAKKSYISDIGLRKLKLNDVEFEEVFGPLLSDTEEGFRVFQVNGAVSVLEVLATAYVFCSNADMDQKVEAVFHLFDLDGSGTLNAVEVEIMMECCTNGMCKAAKLRPPETFFLEGLVAGLFYHLQREASKDLCLCFEVKSWIASQRDITEFLGYFTDATLIISSKRQVEKIVREVVLDFTQQAGAQPGASKSRILLPSANVRKLITCVNGNIAKPEEVETVIKMMGGDGEAGNISLSSFVQTIHPWVAFAVIDRDKSGTLDRKECKALMWIRDGLDSHEPTPPAVRATMLDLDKNGDKTIDRVEWVAYNVALPGAGEWRLSSVEAIKRTFEKYDRDAKGAISRAELECLLRDLCLKGVQTFGDVDLLSRQSRVAMHTVLHNTSMSLADKLDGSGNGLIEWSEFKECTMVIDKAIEDIQEFILKLLERDQIENLLTTKEDKTPGNAGKKFAATA